MSGPSDRFGRNRDEVIGESVKFAFLGSLFDL